jgi:hypothetical protein
LKRAWSVSGGVGGKNYFRAAHDIYGVGYFYNSIQSLRLTSAVGRRRHSASDTADARLNTRRRTTWHYAALAFVCSQTSQRASTVHLGAAGATLAS